MSTATIDLDQLSDTIANLTLKQAKELSDKLEEKHGIKAAAGGAVMMAAPVGGGGAAAPAAEEKTAFDVVLTGFGDKKLAVIKEVRAILPGLSLPDAKNLVEKVPGKIKEGVSKEEAEQVKKKLEEAGGTVEIK
jgi:large subunit ribosomal protein L7/L12